MEPDEIHESQEKGMDLTEFEEQNIDQLIEKFMKIKEVADLWADFVYNEYNQRQDREER